MPHPSVRRPEQASVDDVVGLLHVKDVGYGPVLKRSKVIESVVAHDVPLGHNPVVQVMVSEHVLANHEESGLYSEFLQRVKNERGRLGDRPVIKRQINRTLVLVHSPSRPGV